MPNSAYDASRGLLRRSPQKAHVKMNHTRIEMQAMDAQIQLTREIRKLREEMKVNTHAIVTAILAVADQRFTQEEASKVADDLMFDPPEPS